MCICVVMSFIPVLCGLMVNSAHDTPRLAMQSMATATDTGDDDGGIGREGKSGLSVTRRTMLGGKGFPWVYRNIPIGSMYGIFTYIWIIYGVNVGKYSIHGSYGIGTSELHFHKANSQIILEIRRFLIRDFLGSYCGRGIVEIQM